jgi:hypothetical protein
MTDPATDPDHDLLDHPQDGGVDQPHIRLGTFLALLRVLAGRRGWATVAWNRSGFTYVVTAQREGGAPGAALDIDPTATGGDQARAQLLAALEH